MAFLYRTSKFNLNTQIILTKSDKVPENKLNDKILGKYYILYYFLKYYNIYYT